MSIDKFLNDLDKQGEELEKQQKLAEEKRQKKTQEDAAYLSEFSAYYVNVVSKILRTIQNKLQSKFDFVYDRTMALQQHDANFASIHISPKFDTNIKTVTITFVVEAGRRLVSISTKATDVRNNEIRKVTGTFQDTFDKFKMLDLDYEISKILEQVFLMK